MHKPFSVPLVPDMPEIAPQAVTFTGERREFRKLVSRGAWLELVTLGFYRFWLATDMRKHLWSHTEVHGDAAEYTGTAKELLIGFLVAMMALIFVLGLVLESVSIILITTPVILPLLDKLGIDRVWYGVLLTINLELALISPPVVTGSVPEGAIVACRAQALTSRSNVTL